MKLYEEEYTKYFGENEWVALSSTESYIVGINNDVVVSHYKNGDESSVAFQELTKEAFVAHYKANGYMLNTKETTYDIMDVPKDDGLRYHVISQMSCWCGGEFVEKVKPQLKKFGVSKPRSIALCNSGHEFVKYGMRAHAVPSPLDKFKGHFFIEVEDTVVIINKTHVGYVDGHKALERTKRAVNDGEDIPYTKTKELDPKNKYIANDILELLKGRR